MSFEVEGKLHKKFDTEQNPAPFRQGNLSS